ncbi:type II toxin-antitoxin system VapC family toxin [Desulfosarcina ovata]|uniref:type II toxin-antitoxin system VapC family toxin n=1 Tax=Desulfosarcina ovata TaxID=83564 RepID=UPI0013913817|nr:type II toxin-antitoxin system VapC family toxin [Desulfosarcina ovata]
MDTNIVSYWMRGDSAIIQKIQTFSPSDLSLSTVTLAEIYYGIEKSPTRKKERQLKIERIKSQLEIYPFNESAALKYGSIRASLEKQGQPISERDLQIAAIALANKFCVVTHNVKEFRRITDLKVEDWAQD